MTNSSINSINLFYTEGSSDKVYSAQIEPKAGGFVVNFQYGRRGSSLKADTKTVDPVSIDSAIKIFSKLVLEKKSKGYTEAKSGERYQDTEKAGRVTGLIPQLLNVVREDTLSDYLMDSSWLAQEKYDGERRLIVFDKDGVSGTNREGLTIAISSELEKSLLEVATGLNTKQGRTVFDGEDLGGKGYVVFDILEQDGVCLRNLSYEDRLNKLNPLLKSSSGLVRCVKTYFDNAAKSGLIKHLRSHRAEGLVFKKKDATWNGGRPSSGGSALKFKFIENATVRAGKGREGKRSVSLWVLDKTSQDVCVGNVLIPTNAEIPKEGDLIDVGYLYAFPGGSLYQPTFERARKDKSEPDREEGLKLKQENLTPDFNLDSEKKAPKKVKNNPTP